MDSFHGSFQREDVTYLLTPIPVTKANYNSFFRPGQNQELADAINSESVFSTTYINLFRQAVERNGKRVAIDALNVAQSIAAAKSGEIVIASLVRAGVSVGVLVHRALKMLGRTSHHYAISATRKRGSDPSALDYILTVHAPESIAFLDGWTGKGYIADELRRSIAGYNATRGVNIDPALHVLADLAGASAVANSSQDYLIPSAMLRATGCGLISASMTAPEGYTQDALTPDFCLYYEFLQEHDMSRYFVEAVSKEMEALLALPPANRDAIKVPFDHTQRAQAKAVSDRFVCDMMQQFALTDRNKVKPGVCEAYRALLTRQSNLTLLIGKTDRVGELFGLYYLARQRSVEVISIAQMPYRAAVVING